MKRQYEDCVICALANSEGISWQAARRKLIRYRTHPARLGVQTTKVVNKGLSGYRLRTGGAYENLSDMFDHKTGILFLGWGDGSGHALYYDGARLVDHVMDGRFHRARNLDDLREGERVSMVLIRETTKQTGRQRGDPCYDPKT